MDKEVVSPLKEVVSPLLEEKEFLASYDQGKYPRPSVTADIVVLTVAPNGLLMVLLIKRRGFPFRGKWALPGGFLSAGKESVDQAAERELFEETGVSGCSLRQLYTFSEPDRDPRCHVVSVAYTALVPFSRLSPKAGDDANEALLFSIFRGKDGLVLKAPGISIREDDLAFDHAKILRTALERLKNRVFYEPDAFELLEDRDKFTVFELQRIFEAIRGEKLDPSNFRKMFKRSYLFSGGENDTGYAHPTGEKEKISGRRSAALFSCNKE